MSPRPFNLKRLRPPPERRRAAGEAGREGGNERGWGPASDKR
jgi:hypothetical protein